MTIYIVGESALHYWRHIAFNNKTLSNHPSHLFDDCPKSPSELKKIILSLRAFGHGPLHLMVASPNERISRNTYKYSIRSKALPNEAFCLVARDLCVASPEYCLLQLGLNMSIFRIIELCMELCGKYTLVEEAKRGFNSRDKSLATVKSITALLDQISNEKGKVKIKTALRYVKEGSRSPMETREYLLMCLPKRYGGYGLPLPELNVRIDLTPEERRSSGREFLEVDLLWHYKKVVIEYDGHEDHESRENRARDASKRNILLAKGYKVYVITGKQICNVLIFHSLVKEIAKSIGFRMRAFPDNWEFKRQFLRDELFKSLSPIKRD